MRSFSELWATLLKYPSDPLVSTKAPPSSGQQASGYEKEKIVAPQIWNYWRWQQARAIRDAHSVQRLNWYPAEGPVPLAFTVKVAGYDAQGDVHTLFLDAATGNPADQQEIISYGGCVWQPAGIGGLPNYRVNDFVSNQLRSRIVLLDNTDSIYFSNNVSAWVTWPGGYPSPARTYTKIESKWGDGQDYSFADSLALLYYAPSPTQPIVGAASDPGFANPPVVDIRHAHHFAGLLWPDDLGNAIWMAMTTDELATSTNGTNWTSAITHGMDLWTGVPNLTVPKAFGYSAYGTKWIAVIGRSTAGLGTIGYSTDNGLTWIEVNDVIPSTIRIEEASIDCDLFGNWVIGISDLVAEEVQYFGSFDNGETWHKLWEESVYFPAPYVGGSGGFLSIYAPDQYVWYGGGRFHIATSEDDTGGGNISIYHSPRTAE